MTVQLKQLQKYNILLKSHKVHLIVIKWPKMLSETEQSHSKTRANRLDMEWNELITLVPIGVFNQH